MTFQQLITILIISSLGLTWLILRLTDQSILNPFTPLILTLLLAVHFNLAVAYNIFVYPRISPLRHLPAAPQVHPLRRLLKEPNPWQFETWVNSVHNEGLIRYYGILNIERVLVTSPDVVKTILQTQVYSFRKQYSQRSYFEKVQGYGLVLQEGKFHKHARKLIGHALGQPRVIADYWPIIQRKVSEMLEVVADASNGTPSLEKQTENKSTSQPTLVINDLMSRTVFDVSGEVSYNIDFQSVLNPERHYTAMNDYNAVFEGNPDTRTRLVLGFILPKWLIDLLPIKFNFTAHRGLRHFNTIGREYMSRTTPSIAAATPHKSVMDELIASKQMDDKELWEQYVMMLPGALHNTVSGMHSAIWFLAQPQYKHIQEKLHTELTLALADVDDSTVPLATFEKCTYLKAVINEVLRVHPPASWFGREVYTPTLICGALLPKGLSVGLSPWAFHRDQRIWGADAAVFRPERWFEGDTRTTAENTAWLTFGAGPRRCVGEQLAKAELFCVLARLFKGWKVEFDFGTEGREVPRVSHYITVAYREPLRVRVTRLDAGVVGEKA